MPSGHGTMRIVADEHYFTAEPTTPAERHPVTFTLHQRDYRLTAAAGVFSADRLDLGTAVLLRKAQLPTPQEQGPLLDLGCGYGPVAVVLASRCPAAQVYAVDVNRRALELVRENARATGTDTRIIAVQPDEISPTVQFSQIWSNPPIRIGKTELHAMLERWLPRLAPGGAAWLVVARHLGGDTLHRWLADAGWKVARHASQKGYRVLRVTRD